jgi:hypothetical protein
MTFEHIWWRLYQDCIVHTKLYIYVLDYKIGIRCFSDKYTLLNRKSKDWLAQNQDNVFEWCDMSTWGL